MNDLNPQHNDKDRIARQEALTYGKFFLENQSGETIINIEVVENSFPRTTEIIPDSVLLTQNEQGEIRRNTFEFQTALDYNMPIRAGKIYLTLKEIAKANNELAPRIFVVYTGLSDWTVPLGIYDLIFNTDIYEVIHVKNIQTIQFWSHNTPEMDALSILGWHQDSLNTLAEAVRRIENYDIDPYRKTKCMNELLVNAQFRNFDSQFDLKLIFPQNMGILKMNLEQARIAGRKDWELKLQQDYEKAIKIAVEKAVEDTAQKAKSDKFHTALDLINDGLEEKVILKNIFRNDLMLWGEFHVWKNEQK